MPQNNSMFILNWLVVEQIPYEHEQTILHSILLYSENQIFCYAGHSSFMFEMK